jgi:hypothetical protein
MTPLRTLALMLALSLPRAAAADTLFDTPSEVESIQQLVNVAAGELIAADAMQGRFIQRKSIPQLPQPLRSEGRFLYARDHGIWWHTETPFPSTLLLTPDGLRQSYVGSRGEVARDPGALAVVDIFFSLLSLDFERLSETFELFGQATDTGWRVGLVPHDAALVAVVQRAVVEGDRSVRHVELISGDDRTEFLFESVESLDRPLSPEELHQFEP